ncbi:MAG: hypothetical protein HY455_03060 [Parcubacteria group bacterium]|nr:hypothetical protein [Parcubacteria group bacterium]
MKPETIARAQAVDETYFGNRPLDQLVAVLLSQVESLRKEPTRLNIQAQTGDIQFVLVSIARNEGWDLDQLLADTTTKVENRRRGRHYYEAHITINPVFGRKLEHFIEVCKPYEFRVATLLMQKRKRDTPRRSKNDSFCTGRSISYSDIETRMLALVAKLKAAGFHVQRFKIESTLLDSRYDDSKFPLDLAKLPEKEITPRAPASGALSGRKEK